MMNRSRLLLLLVCLLGLAVWYAWQQSPDQERVGTRPGGGKSTVGARKVTAQELSRLDFSGGKPNEFHSPKRDLFRQLFTAPAVVKVAPPPKPIAPPPPPPPPPKPVTPPPVVAGPKPIPPLTVLGFLEKDAVKTAFLASKQGEIFLVKQGDRFADDLLVRELSDKEIRISRTLQDAGVTMKVGEKRNQRMANLNLSSDRPNVPDVPPPDAAANKPAALPGEN